MRAMDLHHAAKALVPNLSGIALGPGGALDDHGVSHHACHALRWRNDTCRNL